MWLPSSYVWRGNHLISNVFLTIKFQRWVECRVRAHSRKGWQGKERRLSTGASAADLHSTRRIKHSSADNAHSCNILNEIPIFLLWSIQCIAVPRSAGDHVHLKHPTAQVWMLGMWHAGLQVSTKRDFYLGRTSWEKQEKLIHCYQHE